MLQNILLIILIGALLFDVCCRLIAIVAYAATYVAVLAFEVLIWCITDHRK